MKHLCKGFPVRFFKIVASIFRSIVVILNMRNRISYTITLYKEGFNVQGVFCTFTVFQKEENSSPNLPTSVELNGVFNHFRKGL